MNVLAIGVSDSVLRQPLGYTLERQRRYADLCGRLDLIVYSARRQGRLEPKVVAPNLTVHPTNSRSRVHFVADALRLGLRLHRMVGLHLVTTQDPFGTGLAGWLLKRRLGVPLEIQNHSNFVGSPEWCRERPLLFGAFLRLAGWLLPRADGLRVVNELERQSYLRLGVAASRIRVIPVPAQTERFLAEVAQDEVSGLKQALGIGPGEPVLLWVGRPVACKRLPLLFETFSHVLRDFAQARLLIVGATESELGSMAGRFGVRPQVVFAGRVDHAELPAYYWLADVYVHTSAYEGLPRTPVEAALCARPVVASLNGGLAEVVVDGQTGYLVEGADAARLAEGIMHLLSHPEKAREMGRRGRELATARFDWEAGIRTVVERWRELAGGRA